MDVSVVGAGRVGTAVAVLLAKGGHRVVAAAGRDAARARVERFLPGVPFVPPVDAARAGEVAILGVPDDALEPVCADLAGAGGFGPGRWAVHLSGSLSLRALAPAAGAGAGVLALHPLQTVPDVEAGLERLPGSGAAVTAGSEEGLALGERLAGDAGLRPFRLDDARKPLYHAAAVFASNYLTVATALAERLLHLAGVDDPLPVLTPLAEAAVANAARLGPGPALTGPAARGDAGTVRHHLEALDAHHPEAVAAYVALARAALEIAAGAERLSGDARAAVEEVLAEWS